MHLKLVLTTLSFEAEDEYEPERCPERALIAAMIRRAMVDATGKAYYSDPYVKDRYDREARQWLGLKFIPPTDYQPFGFGWCCVELEIDPESIRSLTRGLIKAGIRLLW